MSNPRRNAFEYGVLVTLGASMAVSYAILLAYSSSTNSDGKRRKLPKVNLDDEIDLGQALADVKSTFWAMRRGDVQSPFDSSNKSSSSGLDKSQGGKEQTK